MNITVVVHDPEWSRKFETEAAALGSALGSAASAIHHVGSTAIFGIFAKPVIDILVEAVSVEAMDGKTASMEELGYEAKGEYGIPGRRYFRKDSISGVREFQVHAFVAGSVEVARHLAFRDYLRSHPDVAREYSRLKRELARRCSDAGAYMDGKEPFIRATQRTALRWWRSSQGRPGAGKSKA